MSDKSRIPLKLPLKVRLLLAAHTFAVDNACRSNLTVNRTLLNMFDPKVPPSERPINGVSSFDTAIDPSHNLWFRLYNPAADAATTSDANLPVIVYFHGGGFCFNAANSRNYDLFCQRMAREIPAIVLSVNYRLAPEHQYPCQYEDGIDTLMFIDGMNFENFSAKVDLRRCFIAGDSAGGNLAHNVVLKANEYEFSNIEIIGLIAIQPFFGGKERTESEIRLTGVPVLSIERTDWLWKAYLPQGSDRNHPAINVFGPNGADISGVKFPRTLLFIGGFDPLQDWQKRYCEGLKKAGKEVHLVEYTNAIHGFYTMPELPESSLLIDEVRDFVQMQPAHT